MNAIFHDGYARILCIFKFYLHNLAIKQILLTISVAYIKEEIDDAAFVVKIESDGSPLLIKMDGFNGSLITKKENQIIERNCTMEEIDIKEEPLQDYLVS